MFIDRLFNQGNAPMLAQAVRFTQARQELLQNNVANVSTPGFKQKDLSMAQFQSMLRSQLAERESHAPGAVSFDQVLPEVNDLTGQLVYHDGNNRSMEQLMADGAKNAMMHNFFVELLRKQFGSMQDALRERVT
jgi:flagellar basal-body rod protein FlgB